jgi:release factor glutamine methyltransferase
MSEPKTVVRLVDLGERVLSDSSHVFEDHDNRKEAEELLAFCMGIEPDDLDDDAQPPRRTRERYLSLVARRAGGEPFPFLTGHIEFYGLDLRVRPGAFVPRPSSELLVDRAVRLLRRRRSPVVVDVCTGAGPIALAVAAELPHAQVWGADIADEGLAQGRSNARSLTVNNVRFRRGDMYAPLPARLKGRVDVITGHIPYVPSDELEDLPAEVREFEPVYTLTDATAEGLHLVRRAAGEAPEWLRAGGWILLEVSEDLAGPVRRICRKAGFGDARVASDADRLSVVVEARLNRR